MAGRAGNSSLERNEIDSIPHDRFRATWAATTNGRNWPDLGQSQLTMFWLNPSARVVDQFSHDPQQFADLPARLNRLLDEPPVDDPTCPILPICPTPR
jgi:hypothetical protein